MRYAKPGDVFIPRAEEGCRTIINRHNCAICNKEFFEDVEFRHDVPAPVVVCNACYMDHTEELIQAFTRGEISGVVVLGRPANQWVKI